MSHTEWNDWSDYWHEWIEHCDDGIYFKHLDTFPVPGTYTGSAYLCTRFGQHHHVATTGLELYLEDDVDYFIEFITGIRIKYNGEKSIPLKVMDDLVVYSGDETGEE